jgi:hypothetical protein
MQRPSEDELTTAIICAVEKRPANTSWGFYAYSDAPPVFCGSGSGAFHWFKNQKSMLAFVDRYLAWWHPAPSSMAPEDIAATVQGIMAGSTWNALI